MTKKEEGAVEDFMDGLMGEEKDPFEPNDNEDLFPEEKEAVAVEEEQEQKPVPFHKDEKVQKYLDKQLRKQREDLIKELKPASTETFKQEVSASDPDLVKAFEGIIGNDTPEKQAALKALERSLANVDERATKKAIDRIQQVQKEQADKEISDLSEAQNEIEDGFDEIEDHYGIDLTDRQKEEYKKFLLKVEPRGGYVEYPDFVETFQVFKDYVKANRPSNSQAKALASRGMERSSSTSVTAEASSKRDGTKSLWQMLGQ